MKWLLSLIIGLLIAWAILSFIGPKKVVSYYVQAPVQPTPLTDLDIIMEAVGLKPSVSEKSVAEIAIMEPAPSPESSQESVADMATHSPMDATNEITPTSDRVYQDMSATPQPAAPSYGPAPVSE
jgi:cytoskeletal protein RodZ